MADLIPFAAVIPAAGTSIRMGTSKSELRLPDGITFLENLITQYKESGADPVVVVVNAKTNLSKLNSESAVFVINEHIDYGRSYSIKLGLQKIIDSRYCFIQNIDNQYFNLSLLNLLLNKIQDDSYVIPVFEEKGGHPVLLGERIITALLDEEPFPDFRKTLQRFRRIEIPWNDPGILLNINNPTDYQKFLRETTIL